tara:strand:- start:672 stop:1589 length:918 start_codon:yes stop_codon:yes gene_type:complete
MKVKKICILGYGSHVKKTIIPSLDIKPKNIKIVTKKIIKDYETFTNIKLALKKLTKDYVFFNSTPPKYHFSTSKLILSSGFNIIIEKPICINKNQLIKLNDIAKKKRLFMFENMMYLYSKQFQIVKNLIKKKRIKKINIRFAIPDFSKTSFRTNNIPESSILYDMGCYPFSFISYFGFDNKNYKVSYKKKNKKIIFVKVLFNSKNIQFAISLAIYKSYENYIKIFFEDKSSFQFNHFFYGKKIQKLNYFVKSNKKVKILKIKEENLFKKIFSQSKEKLLKISDSHYKVTKNYLISLSRIKKYIKL